MDKYLYQCLYCGKEYIPKRRYKQIFCSNSCRTNSHIRLKKSKLPIKENIPESSKSNKVEKMSWAGVGNAAAGAFLANKIDDFFKGSENKPVTRKEINELITTLKGRYLPVKNAPKNSVGASQYFDILTLTYVYFKK